MTGMYLLTWLPVVSYQAATARMLIGNDPPLHPVPKQQVVTQNFWQEPLICRVPILRLVWTSLVVTWLTYARTAQTVHFSSIGLAIWGGQKCTLIFQAGQSHLVDRSGRLLPVLVFIL